MSKNHTWEKMHQSYMYKTGNFHVRVLCICKWHVSFNYLTLVFINQEKAKIYRAY